MNKSKSIVISMEYDVTDFIQVAEKEWDELSEEDALQDIYEATFFKSNDEKYVLMNLTHQDNQYDPQCIQGYGYDGKYYVSQKVYAFYQDYLDNQKENDND